MKKALVICTGNSCRSQMAEGWLRHFGGDRIEAMSAGTHPSFVHPLAIMVMKEVGIDISTHYSKSVDDFAGTKLDYVITVCDDAREACPVLPGDHRSVHMPFEDPTGFIGPMEKKLEHFRRVRDQIGEAMKAIVHLISPIQPDPNAGTTFTSELRKD